MNDSWLIDRFIYFLVFRRPSHSSLHKATWVWEIMANDNLLFVCIVDYFWESTKTCKGTNKTKTFSTGDESVMKTHLKNKAPSFWDKSITNLSSAN